MMRHAMHFLILVEFLVAMMAAGAAFAAVPSPGKWRLNQAPAADCVSTEIIEGFATCNAGAIEFDQRYMACNPTHARGFDINNPCGDNEANYVTLWYTAPFGSPSPKGNVKSYCDDWDSNSRGNLFISAHFNTTVGVHCPSSIYSRRANLGNPGYCPDCMQGNPINPAVGNKYQVESDYIGSGLFSLQFVRHYNSLLAEEETARIGANWSHNYNRRLFLNAAVTNPVIVEAIREDGRAISYIFSGGVYVRDPIVVERLEKLPGAWRLINSQDEVELYDNSGKLTSITNRAGLAHTLAYDAQGRLTSVTDSFGRSLSLTYDSSSRIATLTVPGGLTYQYAYTAYPFGTYFRGNLFRVTYPDATTRIYHYENASFPSHLTGITDENGQRFSTYTYVNIANQGWTSSTEQAGGAGRVTMSFTESTSNNIRNVQITRHVDSGITLPITFTFNTIDGRARNTGIGVPVSFSCVDCGPAARTYDANGNVLTQGNWRNFWTRFDSYELARNLETRRTQGLTGGLASIPNVTRTITTQWHSDYRLRTGIAEPLRITTMAYGVPTDPNPGNRGSLLSRTIQATADADGAQGFGATPTGAPRTWTYTYNANGSVLTMDGPRTDVSDLTTYTYYANNATCPGANAIGCRGQVESVTNAAGHVTQITEYNVHGQPLTIVDPNGLATTLAYDQRQRLTSRNVGGETTTYTYDNAGQLTRVTLPDGSFLQYTYDAAHRLTQVADNLGNRINYTLDLAGNRKQEQVFDPLNQLAQTRSRVFDYQSRLIQEIGAAGQTTLYDYHATGSVRSIDGPLAGTVDVTNTLIDPLDRLIRVTDPQSGQVNYTYDRLDQLTSVSDPRGLLTTYSYDGLGNLNQQVSPDTGATVNTYDAAGNLLTQTDAKGQVTTYTYDVLNRVASIAYQGGATHTYQYDRGANGKGRLTQVTEPASTTTYAYDQKGRLVAETRLINAVSYVTAYSYDAAGRMTGITYPSGREVNYTLDSLGRIQAIATTRDSTTLPVVSSVAYRPFGPTQGFTFGNGQSYTRGFDTDGRIASYTLATQSIAVGYDPASRIGFLSDTGNPVNTHNYGYDTLDRLTSYTGPSANQAFSYDGVGNRLTKTVGANTDTYSPAGTSNRLASITPSSGPVRNYAYDATGSTTGDSVNTFTYDTRGRLTQAVSTVGTTDYQVNSLGQRIRKTNPQGDTLYHYDAQGRLIAESSASGQVQKEYIYLGDTPVAVLQ